MPVMYIEVFNFTNNNIDYWRIIASTYLLFSNINSDQNYVPSSIMVNYIMIFRFYILSIGILIEYTY